MRSHIVHAILMVVFINVVIDFFLVVTKRKPEQKISSALMWIIYEYITLQMPRNFEIIAFNANAHAPYAHRFKMTIYIDINIWN